jgi:glycosyltransferase involved in cell wall biosynthesis
VVGFGTLREGLQVLVHSLSAGGEKNLKRLAELGRLLEGGPAEPLERFALSEELPGGAEGLADHVQFVGLLYHEELAKLLPVADAAVIPSIFPETFGLVAAEFAASGVLTIAADHSGLREAGEIIGKNLPFDLPVGLDGFEENLARALTRYFKLSREERRRLGEIVRHNSVEHLSWETLAQRLVDITGG